VKTVLKIVVSSLILGGLLWYLDLGAVFAHLRQVNPVWVVLSCLCMIAGQTLCALRWSWLARGLGMQVRLSRKVQLYFLGMFLSLFLPSIIGGDVARGYLLAKGRQGQGWAAAASVVLERINGIYAMTIIVTVCMLFLPIPGTWMVIWMGTAILLWMAMFTYGLWHALLPRFLAFWKALPLMSAGFRRAWWKGLPLSVVFQLMVVVAHMLLGHAVGLHLSWAAYGFMVCLVALASAVPVSFNGFGVREAGYIGIAGYFGGGHDAAAAMATLWIVVLTLSALPGGIVLWRLGGLGALTAAKSEEGGQA